MLYMIFDKKSDTNLVKVGRAKSIEERAKSYATHNPLAELRWICQGTSGEEMRARKQILECGGQRVKKIRSNEWIEVPIEIYNHLYEKGFSALKGFASKNPRKYKG